MEPRPAAPRRGDVVVMAGVAAIVAASVGIVGGAHPATQVAISAAVLLLFAAFAVMRGRRGIRPVAFSAAAALAVAFTLFQLVPLPGPIVGLLSPLARELRQETSAARMIPLTLDVPATMLALARGLACLGLLLVVAGSIRSSRSARRYLWIVAGCGGALAVVAITQRALHVESILGVYKPRSQPGFGVFGTFVDVNHAASVLALTTLVACGLAVDRRGPARGLAIAIALVCSGALLYTSSRGGLVGFGIAAFLFAAIVVGRAAGAARGIVAASIVLLAGTTIAVWTSGDLRQRFSGPTEQMVHNQKTRGWADGLRMAVDYRWTGVGRGAFEAPLGAYRRNDESVRLVYPENILVQMASEWGLPIAIALVAMILVTSRRLAAAVVKLPPAAIGGGCGVIAVVVHDLFDFGLELPGVAVPTIVTLAIVVGSLISDERKQSPRRPRNWRAAPSVVAPVMAGWLLIIAGAAWAAGHTLDADYERLRAQPDPAGLQAAIMRHPADDYFELLAAVNDARRGSTTAMHHLNRALRLHPTNATAHYLAARLLAASQHPAQAALEYRLAAEHGMNIDMRELLRVLGGHVIESVPQQPGPLVDLARSLYGIGNQPVADVAARRAVDSVDALDAREPLLVTRARMAAEFNARPQMLAAANDLLAEATLSDSFVVAAQTFAHAGETARANQVIDRAIHAHPLDSSLMLAAARLRLGAGDLVGARSLVVRSSSLALTLQQRQEAEELTADIADRAGDVDTAVMARARARLIARRLHDMRQDQQAAAPQ